MKRLAVALLTGVGSLLTTPAMAANMITLTLNAPVKTITTAGAPLSYYATIVASGSNTDAVYINGNAYAAGSGGGLSVNGTPLFYNFPASLVPGQSVSGLLFTVTVPTAAAAGNYTGTFSLFGGASRTAYASLAAATFQVDVVSAAAPVPEAASWATMTLGMGAVGYALRRRRATVMVAA